MGRNIIIWLVFGAALLALFNLFQSPSSTSPGSQLAYSDFIAEVEGQQVEEALGVVADMVYQCLNWDVVSHNTTMSAYAKGNLWLEALGFPKEMAHLLLMPSQVSYNSTISADEKGNHWEGSIGLLQAMLRR